MPGSGILTSTASNMVKTEALTAGMRRRARKVIKIVTSKTAKIVTSKIAATKIVKIQRIHRLRIRPIANSDYFVAASKVILS